MSRRTAIRGSPTSASKPAESSISPSHIATSVDAMKITSLIENTPGAEGCVSLHGLSLYVETCRHRVLMDFGPSDETLRNAERLGVDLRDVDVAVLSHGHYDHSGGLLAFAEINRGAPIYMQRSATGENYAYDGLEKGHRYIGIDGRIAELPQVRFLDGDFRIDEELDLFTVKSRKFPLPSTNRRIVRKTGDGFVQDDFSHEQCLYVRSGRSSALLSGCAHSGILNVMDAVAEKFGRERLPDVVVSGFHLMRKTGYEDGDMKEQDEIAARLKEFPCRFCTCHCTGVEPYDRMKSVMGAQLAYLHCGETFCVR